MDLRRAESFARSWALWFLGACLGAGLIALAVSSVLPKAYESQTRLLVGQALSAANPDVDLFESATNLAQTYADIARGPNLRQRVIDRVGLEVTVEELDDQVSVRAVRDLPFIEISATADTPELAAAIAKGIADELLAIAPTIGSSGDPTFAEEDLERVRAEIEAVSGEVSELLAIEERTAAEQGRLDALLSSLTALRSFHAAYAGGSVAAEANRLAVVDDAIVPLEAASPRPLFNAALAAVLAFLVVGALAVLVERLDDRLATGEDVERVTGLPTLATVVSMPGGGEREPFYRLATLLHPRSPAAEAFRSLRTNIEFSRQDEAARTIVVTSSSDGEGKTVVASNLAVVFAQSGRRTILVDADLRRPAVHTMFSVPSGPGLTDLVRWSDLKLDEVAHQTEEANLRVVSAGTTPPNPAELLGWARTAAVFEQLAAAADVVIIDTPPVGMVTDGAVVAARSDATILVVELRRTTERSVRRGREALAKVSASVIGTVINKVPKSLDTHAFYGTYGEPPAPSPDDRAPAKPASPVVAGAPTAVWPAAGGGERSPGEAAPDRRRSRSTRTP